MAVVETAGNTRLYIRRIGARVTLAADYFYLPNTVTPNTPMMIIPMGFRANRAFRTSGGYEAGAIFTALTSDGNTIAPRLTTSGSSRFYAEWVTDDAWPTTLPGTPS